MEKKKAKKQKKEKEVNITKHFLVPLHVKLDEKEAKELLKKLNINKNQLPRIRINDPAIKNLNVKPGDIIKIVRRSPTAGESIYYRVVVEG